MPERVKGKQDSNGAIRADEAYAQVLGAIQAVAVLHVELPGPKETKECIYNLKTLLSRLSEYASVAHKHDKTSSKNKSKNPHKKEAIQERKDKLDREGVMLWNRSTTIKQSMLVDHQERTIKDAGDAEQHNNIETGRLVAYARLVAAHLVELGSTSPAKPQDTFRTFELYAKAAQEFLSCKDTTMAEKACKAAATHQTKLQDADLSAEPQVFRRAVSKAMVSQTLARSNLAWLQDKADVAKYTMKEAIKDTLLSDCDSREVEMAACQAYQFAYSLLREVSDSTKEQASTVEGESTAPTEKTASSKSKKAHDAIEWLQMAIRLLEKEGCMGNLQEPPLTGTEKRLRSHHLKAMKALAQAYLEAGLAEPALLSKAESTLDEVLKIEISPKVTKLKLRLLIKRNAGETEIQNCLNLCVGCIELGKEPIISLVKEVRQLAQTRRTLISSLLRSMAFGLVGRAQEGGLSFVYLPLVAFFHNLINTDKEVAKVREMSAALQSKHRGLAISKEATFVCQSLLLKYGDLAYKQAKYDLAASWYLLACDPLFKVLQDTNFPKARRKAALSLLRAEHYTEAEKIIRDAGADTASDHYVLFLSAVQQELQGQAIRALQNMATSKDFALEMLLWSARQAQECELKQVVEYCIRAIYQVTQETHKTINGVDGLMLIRSLIGTSIEKYEASGEEAQPTILASVLEQFATANQIVAVELVQETAVKPGRPMLSDVAWIYKKALNFSLAGYKTFCKAEIVSVFTAAANLADSYLAIMRREIDASASPVERATVRKNAILLKYAAISSEIDMLREGAAKSEEYDTILEQLAELLVRLDSLQESQDDFNNVKISITAYQFELLVCLFRWEDAKTLIQEASNSNLPIDFFQKAAGIACSTSECPSDVVMQALEAVLGRLSESQTGDPTKLSRYFRGIIASSMERNDFASASQYINAALNLLESSARDYPRAEVEWLATTCWNTGMDLFPIDPDDGSSWCEVAFRFATNISGYADMAQSMKRYYQVLLKQYPLQVQPDSDNSLL